MLLGGAAFVVLLVMIAFIPILRANPVLTLLSFVTVFLTCFLMDFLFRGIEEMQIITIRYTIMRGIAAVLTFVFVKNDRDILWIPILDILGSLVAIGLVSHEMKKRGFQIRFSSFHGVLKKLKESAIYFLSNMATTAFTALNTILIGFYIEPHDIANWSLCMQMVSAVQALYSPITDGIYPYMVKKKSLSLIKKTAAIFMSIVTAGCIFTFFAAKYAILILGGEKYLDAVPLLRAFIPLLFFSFPSILLGWPALGAIGRVKETTATTVVTAVLQITGIIILIVTGQFTVVHLALLRGIMEFFLMSFRGFLCYRYRKEFSVRTAEHHECQK